MKSLNLPIDKDIDFKVVTFDKSGFIKVYLGRTKDKIDQSKAMLVQLTRQLHDEYAPIVSAKIRKIDNDISLKKNQIKKRIEQIKISANTTELIEERIIAIERELGKVRENTDQLIAERDIFLESSKEDTIFVVLYATTVQQAIEYLGQLDGQLNSLKTRREQKENEIKDLEVEIENINLEIGNLNIGKEFTQNIKELRSPPILVRPLGKNTKKRMLIAGVLGLMLGVFAAFFAEFWQNNIREKNGNGLRK